MSALGLFIKADYEKMPAGHAASVQKIASAVKKRVLRESPTVNQKGHSVVCSHMSWQDTKILLRVLQLTACAAFESILGMEESLQILTG